MGLMPASDVVTKVRINLVNNGVLYGGFTFKRSGGTVCGDGETGIDGVPEPQHGLINNQLTLSVITHLLPTKS